MRITTDREVCIGSGNCTLTAPAVFDQDETDGRVRLLDPAPPAELAQQVRRAAYVCPSGAITVDED
jgi:ferredoxin